jgi:hypothetical protein
MKVKVIGKFVRELQHHAMKTYGIVAVMFHLFSNSDPGGGEW